MSAPITGAGSKTYSHVTVKKGLTIGDSVVRPGSHYVHLHTEAQATTKAVFSLPGDAIIKSVTIGVGTDVATGTIAAGAISFRNGATDYTGSMDLRRGNPSSAVGKAVRKVTPPAPVRIPSGVELTINEDTAVTADGQEYVLCVEYALIVENDARNVAAV